VQSFSLDTSPQSFCYSVIAMSITRCSKSAQKFAVQVCQVATVVMETTQLVLRQLINFLSYQSRIEWSLSLPKIISKFCGLLKLCHNNRSGPVFLETQCSRDVLVLWWVSCFTVIISFFWPAVSVIIIFLKFFSQQFPSFSVLGELIVVLTYQSYAHSIINTTNLQKQQKATSVCI